MFLYIVVGISAKKTKIIKSNSARDMSLFMTSYIMPFNIINALQTQVDSAKIWGFISALLLSLFAHTCGILLSYIIIPKKDGRGMNNFEQLCCAMGNSSFMAFPLIKAVMGDEALLYGAAFLIPFHIIFWSWGIYIVDGEKFNLKKFISQPSVISIAIGLILFLFSVKLPTLAAEWVDDMSGIATPLSMIIFGVFIADTNIIKTVTNTKIYRVVLVKNILMPLVLILFVSLTGIYKLIPNGNIVAKTVAISCSSACGISSVLVVARKGNEKNSLYTSEIVALSTICVIATLPLTTFIAGILIP